MKRQLIAVAIGSLIALPAFADGEIGFDFWTRAVPKSSVTRAQVRAEVAIAYRAGTMVVDSESGRTAREMFPNLYPAPTVFAGKTREQVHAELVAAHRAGNIVIDGETGKLANQMFPTRYAESRTQMHAGSGNTTN
jgi:hypothetical protein